jgi:hypothetical protein
VYTQRFDTIAADRGENVVDGLLSALEDKIHEVSITKAAKGQATAQFKLKSRATSRTSRTKKGQA